MHVHQGRDPVRGGTKVPKSDAGAGRQVEEVQPHGVDGDACPLSSKHLGARVERPDERHPGRNRHGEVRPFLGIHGNRVHGEVHERLRAKFFDEFDRGLETALGRSAHEPGVLQVLRSHPEHHLGPLPDGGLQGRVRGKDGLVEQQLLITEMQPRTSIGVPVERRFGKVHRW